MGSNSTEAWMFVCCECCLLSGRGLCDGLITRPEKSYRLWCVVVCDLETSRMRRPWHALGRSATRKKTSLWDQFQICTLHFLHSVIHNMMRRTKLWCWLAFLQWSTKIMFGNRSFVCVGETVIIYKKVKTTQHPYHHFLQLSVRWL